ncbi:hypothetical protein SEA_SHIVANISHOLA_59 [Gordonia phage Shivanishola]|nr:hypothetical protein SEA_SHIVANISHOLA_59 [Gordonia phage Shivanishola]
MTNQKPSTPPAGPSGVSRPQDNHDVQQALRRVNDVIGGALRQIAAITGQPDPAPPTAPAPNHLDAMRTAYAEGHGDGMIAAKRGDPDDAQLDNPYGKLLDDRREFVREQVNNGYGAQLDENDDDVLGDDNADWFDAVLDAHDEWRSLQRRTEPTDLDAMRPACECACCAAGGCYCYEYPSDQRCDCTRCKREWPLSGGRQPGGWVPPYSADTALGKIWHVVSNPTVPERPEVTVNSVRDVLADMGYHEHVHTRLATDDAPVELCGNRPPALTGIGFVGQYACTLPAGHDGQHSDGQYGVAWDAEAVTDADPLPGCTSTHALGIAVYTCTRPAGHDAFHQDKRYGVAWAADGSSSWRVK